MADTTAVMGKAVSALLLLVAAAARAGPAEDTTPSGSRRTVVALYSISQEVEGLYELSVAVNEGIRKGSRVPVDVYSEYTGLDRFGGEGYEEALRTMLREKYRARKIDLVVVVGPSSLEFVLSRDVFPGVPVVTSYVAGRLVESARRTRAELTGALPTENAPRTVELMLRLYPQTRRIHVVLGASAYERGQAAQGKVLFAPFASRVEITFTSDLTLDQLVAGVRQLSDSELVLWGSMLQDASGRDFDTIEPLTRVSAASRRPVFGVIYEDLGAGILGGELVSMETSGQIAAQLAVRVLDGEPASSIAPVVDAGLAPMFDARQLARWGLGESALPPGSKILFQQPTLLQEHGREIGLGLGIIALESLLVAGLIVQLRRRRRIERALATAETRYRTVADFTHDWEFWRRPDGRFEYLSPACERVSGHPAEDFVADSGLLDRLVHEEDVEIWHQAVSATASGDPVEFRIRTRAGELRWVRFASNPVLLPDGTAAGLRGSIADVTARKLGELALEQAYREIAALKDRLEAENTYYREKIEAVEPSGELLGQSDAMKYLHFRIRQVAPSDTTVLILGETGTGKELVAEAIHALGPRKGRALVKVNCAALPPTLAESELFGHEKGAFTGSMAQRKGRFELADGATLFLDEVGELMPELQAKLLRVLQDGTFERVGGDRTRKVDVRVIAATNRALSRDVAAGRFREDLWYRLNVFQISLPPLRQRKEDIPTLAMAFVDRAAERLGRRAPEVPQSVIVALQAREWPGNVRELQNTIEQAVLISDDGHLRLPDQLPSDAPVPAAPGPRSLEEVERRHILEMLEAANWKLEGADGAAALLGLKPSTLRSRMQKLDIRRPAGA